MKLFTVVLFSMLLCSANSFAADTLYVNAIAEPGGDGQNWNTAYRSLQSATDAWHSGDEIWVAGGTYDIQSSALQLDATKSGIRIYGGFTHGNTLREQRDWFRNATILRATVGRLGCLSMDGCDSLTRIDGLVFENSKVPAVVVAGGAPHFRNCLFRNNSADSSMGPGNGGAMDIHPVGRMRIEYCIFENNTAEGLGGAISVLGQTDPDNYGFGVLLGECIFKGNSAGYGGAVYFAFNAAMPQVTSCIFIDNTALNGGAIGSMRSWVYITNSTFTQNHSTELPTKAITLYLHGGAIQNSIFWNGDLADEAKHITDYDGAVPNDTSTLSTTANLVEKDFVLGFYQSDPQFENAEDPAGPDGYFGTDDDGLRLSSGSLARDAGYIDRFVNHQKMDVIGNPRLVGRKNDLGAYEGQRPDRPSNRELLTELKTGGLTLFFRHGKTDWDSKDPGPSPECFPGRNLIFEGREQMTAVGAAQRLLDVPVGDVESSPVCRCWESALLMTGRYEKVSYWGSGGDQAVLKHIRDSVFSTPPTGGNRIITSHDAVANAMFNPDGDGRDLTSAELMEGDCLFLRPLTDTFAVIGQWCSDTWERYHVRYPDVNGVNDGPLYGQKVVGVIVFPNPTNDLLYISSESEGNIQIADVTGRIIETLPNGMNYSVDVSRWNSGLYRVVNTTTGQSTSFVVAR